MTSLDVVFFGLREQLESSVEHAVLELDFKNNKLTKYFDTTQIFSINFSEIKSAKVNEASLLVQFINSAIPE